MLEAQIHHPTHDKREQVLIVKKRGRHDFGEDIHRVDEIRVSRQGQIHELFNRSSAEQRPDSFVLAHDVVASRVIRPHRALLAKPVQKYVHAAIALIHGSVEGEAQARDHAEVVTIIRTLRPDARADPPRQPFPPS